MNFVPNTHLHTGVESDSGFHRYCALFHQISTRQCVSCYPVSRRHSFLLVIPFFWIFPSFHFSPQWHLSLGRRCGDIYVSLRLSVSESHSLPLGQLWVSVLVAIFCKYKCFIQLQL